MSLRRGLALLLLLMAVPAAWLARTVEVDNTLERWTAASGIEHDTYEAFLQTYGSDEFVVVVVRGEDLFSFASLDAMLEFCERLEQLPGVREVRGMPVVFRDLMGAEDPEELAEEMSSTPFYEGVFMAEDQRATAIWVEVEPPARLGDRRQLMAAVGAAVEGLRGADLEVAVAGSTALIVALDELSESESRRAFVVALTVSLLALMLMLRSLRAALIAGLAAGLCVLLTLAVLAVTGSSLNMITSVLPALLWVLALSGAVHLLRRILHHRDHLELPRAVAAAIADVRRPLVLAALTTACGFISLVMADMAPVRELGVFAACGMLVSLLVNLSFVPAAAELAGLGSRAAARRSGQIRWAALGVERPRLVLVGAAIVGLVLLLLIPRVEVASDPLSFLPPAHPTVADYQVVGQTVGGFYTMEVLLELPGPWTEPEYWPLIDRLSRELEASAIVPRVISPLDLLRKLNHWEHGFAPGAYRLPAGREEAEALLRGLDETGWRALARLVRADGRELRLSALINAMDEGWFLGEVEAVKQQLDQLPEGFDGRVTGQVLLLASAQEALVSSQLKSLGLAVLIVFTVIGVGLASWRLTLVSVLPNLLPLLAAFGLMALARLPLDAATVMVASVALGIAVDDTVHVLAALKDGNAAADLRGALARVTPAMVITTVAACIGFFSLCASSFVPIRDFGLLAGVAMVVALVADLLLIPALVVLLLSRERDLV